MVESLAWKQLVGVMNLSLGKEEAEVNLLAPKGGCGGDGAGRSWGDGEVLEREIGLCPTPKPPGSRMWRLGAKELRLGARNRFLS